MNVANNKRPNVVFILSDDQGYWSLGCYGNNEIVTPNIDKLAQEGVQFNNFFCASPVCSPARASILTGKMPSQHGIIDWLGGGSVNKKDYEGVRVNLKKALPFITTRTEDMKNCPEDATIGFEETITYQRYMAYENGGINYLERHMCFTEIMAQKGYTCALAGKWHLGSAMEAQKGFSYWEVVPRGGTVYMLPEYIRDGKIVIEDRYVTDVITDDAINFIEKNSDSDAPFYLSVHYTAPHDPWEKEDQPEEIWNIYNDCSFNSLPDEPLHPWQVPKRTHPKTPEERRYYAQGYYTCVTAMDMNVGRIVKKLEELDLLENTIIIFTSDNGLNLGHHGIWGKGNGTFPLNMYETSVKVPMVAYHKGKFVKGIKCDNLVSQYDIFPTLLELTGCVDEKVQDYIDKLPGQSFRGLLDGSCQLRRGDVVVYDEYGPVRMIRTVEYKYVYRKPYGPNELYDMTKDPDEKNNLIDAHEYRKIKMELHNKLTSWFEKYVDPVYDGTKYPVDGEGQFERLENFATISKVFKEF